MKLTETQLKQIIKEEITKALDEVAYADWSQRDKYDQQAYDSMRRMSGKPPATSDEGMRAGLKLIWPAILGLAPDLRHEEKNGLGIEIYNLIVDRVKQFPPEPAPEIEVWKEELARRKAARQKRINNLK